MANKNGDILVSIGSELNPSFTKTMSQASGSLGRLYTILSKGAKTIKDTSDRIDDLKKDMEELDFSISKDSVGYKEFEYRQNSLNEKIKESRNKLDEYEDKLKSVKNELKGFGITGEKSFDKVTKKLTENINKLIATRDADKLRLIGGGKVDQATLIAAEQRRAQARTDLSSYKIKIKEKEASGNLRGLSGMKKHVEELKTALEEADKAYKNLINTNKLSKEDKSNLRAKIKAENEEIRNQQNILKTINALWKQKQVIIPKAQDVENKKITTNTKKLGLNEARWSEYVRKVVEKINELQGKIDGLNQKQEEMTKALWFSTGETVINALNKGVTKLTNSFKKLGMTTLKTFGRLSGLWSKTTSDAISLSKAVRLIVQYGFGFRSLYYLVRRFRTGIAQGFEYLGGAIKSSKKQINGFSEEIGKFIEKLKEAVFFFKSAAASALQPLMNVVIPLLSKVVDLADKASFAIAKFFATLTGQTYIYKANKNLETYANALDQATGSAKALENQLAGFDEMNVLSSPSSSTSGSGTQLDTSTWFETAQIEPSKFALMVQNAIENANFTTVGELLGAKLEAMLDSINWNFIFTKVKNIAKDITTFINGFISVDNLGANLGKTIANTINGISGFINTYVQQLDWNDLSKFITDGLNSLITNLKAKDLGRSIGEQAKNILDLFTSILRNLKTKDLMRGISDFIDGLNVKELTKSIKQLASQILKTLGEVIGELSRSQPGLLRITEVILAGIAVIKTATIANSLIKVFTAGEDNLATKVIKPVLENGWEYIKKAITGSTFYPLILSALSQLGTMLAPVAPALIIGGVLVGIGVLVRKHVDNINNELRQAVESVYNESSKYNEILKEINSTTEETIANGEEEARITELYTQKLIDCFDSTGELKEGQEALAQVYLDKLSANGVIAYDTVEDLTQAFKDGKISVDDIITSTKEYTEQLIQTAHAEAYKSAITNLVEEQIKLEKENDELLRQEELKSVAYDNLVKSLTEYIKAHSNYPDNVAESMAIQRVNEKLSEGSEEYLKYAQSILGEEGAQVIASAISGMSEDEIKSFANIDEALAKNKEAIDKNLQDQEYYATQYAQYAVDISTTVTENNDIIETDSDETAKAVKEDWNTTMNSMSSKSKTTQETVSKNMKTMENGVDTSLRNMSSVAETENQKFGNSMAKGSAGGGKAISENITAGLEGANDSTVEAFNSISSNASEGMRSLNDTIYSGMNDVGRTYTNALSKMVDKYNEYRRKTDQGYGSSMGTGFSFSKVSTGGNTLSLSKKTFSNSAIGRLISSLPFLAQGAVIPPNREFLAVLGDQQHGTNIEAPLDTIVQAMQQALSTSGVGGDINVNLVVDGKVLAKTVARYNDKLAFSGNGGRIY